jgi:hypothetical protein
VSTVSIDNAARLERRYRRLLVCYPARFRREREEEMLAVLMAGAADGQARPSVADCVDLLRAAAHVRLGRSAERPSPAVSRAVRLMCVTAVFELVAMVTVVATQGAMHAAILRADPYFTVTQWHTLVRLEVAPMKIGAPIVACLWLLAAWGSNRGYVLARLGAVTLLLLTSVSLLSGLSHDAVTYAPADAIAGGVLWAVAVAAVLMLFSRAPATARGVIQDA